MFANLANSGLPEAIQRMAIIAEYREKNIAQHIERIHLYTKIIAQGMGLRTKDVEIISIASQLHDIGKVGIPEALFLNPSKISAAEMELIKKHTFIGAEILHGSQSPGLQVGETIALTHHERWDGSGYPKGLSGEDIPISGRICAIADVFDALTTPRSYKAEISIQEALALIQKSSGVMFDPVLVSVFSENFSEIIRTYQNNLP